MNLGRKVFLSIAVLCSMSFLTPMVAATTGSETVGINVPTYTKQEIVQFLQEHPISIQGTYEERLAAKYKKEPVYGKEMEPGELSDEFLEKGLNALNNVRFIAGLPADVTLNSAYSKACQAASFINWANGEIDHAPKKPTPVGQVLYQLAYDGASNSNLAQGYTSIPSAIITGWMYDGDSSNIKDVGHRRWILNPSLKKTGFGSINSFYSMYVVDNISADYDKKYSVVAWPAQMMPTDYFAQVDPWSISFDNTFNAKDVTITMTRQSNQRVWEIKSSESTQAGNAYISHRRCGQPLCIIWKPTYINYRPGDVFEIDIAGVTKDGKDYPIHYQVTFFDLENPELNQAVDDIVFTVGTAEYMKDAQLNKMRDPVIVENGRIMFPVSGLTHIMNSEVDWNKEKNSLYYELDNKGILFNKDSLKAYLYNRGTNAQKQVITLKNPMIVKEGKGYIPFAEFCDLMSISYEWDSQTKQIKIKAI